MKFANVDGERAKATPDTKGLCPFCDSEVIAKCGDIKIHHWAHKSKRNCDQWWENETEWHRSWKNKFPEDWQEDIQHAENGERHIADVRTSDGLVIEFQHSYIKPEEQLSRESFYKKMIWVLDGTRLKRDYNRFSKSLEDFIQTRQRGIFYTAFPDECFPKAWINKRVPVFFDFENAIDAHPNITKNVVWGLLPGRQQGKALVLCASKDEFVGLATSGNLFDKLCEINRNSSE